MYGSVGCFGQEYVRACILHNTSSVSLMRATFSRWRRLSVTCVSVISRIAPYTLCACHPRTERSGVKDLAQAPTARPDVYLFLKSYFCITKIRFITPTVCRSFTPCKALRLRMTGAGSVGLNAQYTPINSQIPLCRDDTDVLVGK